MSILIGYVLGGFGLIVQASVAAVVFVAFVGLTVLVLRALAQLTFFVRQIWAVPRGQRRAWVDAQLAAMRRRRGGDDG